MDIKDIPNLLDRQSASDPGFAAFGAVAQRYRLNDPISALELKAFEDKHDVHLPDDYRNFLLAAGNGGAGPYYGLFPLGYFDGSGSSLESWQPGDGIAGQLKKAFPHSTAWNLPAEEFEAPSFETDDEEQRWFEARDQRQWAPQLVDGAFPICHQGCAYRNLLVVTGPERGNVWLDARASDHGIVPVMSSNGQHVSFRDWYWQWLRRPTHFR